MSPWQRRSILQAMAAWTVALGSISAVLAYQHNIRGALAVGAVLLALLLFLAAELK
jgi:hypothetical protein